MISYLNAKNNTKHKKTAFRTNKITTINRKALDNKCTFVWASNNEKYKELIGKLSESVGIT